MKRMTAVLALLGISVIGIGCQNDSPRWVGRHNSPAFRTHLADGQTAGPHTDPFLQSQMGPGGQPGMNGASSGRVHLADQNQMPMPGTQSGGAVTVVQTGYQQNPQQQPYMGNPFPTSPGAGNRTSHDWHPSQTRNIGPQEPAVYPH